MKKTLKIDQTRLQTVRYWTLLMYGLDRLFVTLPIFLVFIMRAAFTRTLKTLKTVYWDLQPFSSLLIYHGRYLSDLNYNHSSESCSKCTPYIVSTSYSLIRFGIIWYFMSLTSIIMLDYDIRWHENNIYCCLLYTSRCV